jgi:hypothetical protein
MNEDKKRFLDDIGRPLTQSLFLEIGYSDSALYTLKEFDHEYKGKTYPSAKRLYMELEDPTEYEFATKYFLNWNHWLRICENKILATHINQWRDELEVKLRSRAVRMNIASAAAGNYQAAKWLADRGWLTRGAGRPSKAEVDKNIKIAADINNEYGADVIRLKTING